MTIKFPWKVGELAKLVNRALNSNSQPFDASKITRYRAYGIIPPAFYEEAVHGSKRGFRYADEAQGWAIFGWTMNQAGQTEVHIGSLLREISRQKGTTQETLDWAKTLYEGAEDFDDFVRRLTEVGLDLQNI
ncbi:MAG: hypothetical protein GC204_19345 [Chloroflexi bacterium]|nr:hypothetical protein [Chloroflexota bacterium]